MINPVIDPGSIFSRPSRLNRDGLPPYVLPILR